LTFKITILY